MPLRLELLLLEKADDPPICSSADPIRTDESLPLLLAGTVVATAVVVVQQDRTRMRRAVVAIVNLLIVLQQLCCLCCVARLSLLFKYVRAAFHYAYVGQGTCGERLPRRRHFVERRVVLSS